MLSDDSHPDDSHPDTNVSSQSSVDEKKPDASNEQFGGNQETDIAITGDMTTMMDGTMNKSANCLDAGLYSLADKNDEMEMPVPEQKNAVETNGEMGELKELRKRKSSSDGKVDDDDRVETRKRRKSEEGREEYFAVMRRAFKKVC